MARPKGTYKFTPQEIEDKWVEYKAKCDAAHVWEVSVGKMIKVPNPEVYVLEEFIVFVGMASDTFSRYSHMKRFSGTITRIKEEVFARKKRFLLNGYGSTPGLTFDMRANYKITDKLDLDVNLAATITQVVPRVVDTGVPLAGSEKEIQE